MPDLDGINSTRQGPIANGDSSTNVLNVTQYGTPWHHSHSSLQYANGLAGPMIFHGPSSADYDVAQDPLLFRH